MKILKVHARQILDSRGNPTVEADLKTSKGLFRASVPSGASAGTHEALELRDKDKSRYSGKSVMMAVGNVNNIIAPKLTNNEFTGLREIDNLMKELDGTPNKNTLGANAVLSVSMAAAKALAADKEMLLHSYLAQESGRTGNLLPVPQLNVINGGAHAGQENDIQEHMIMPVGAKSFSEAIQMASETYHSLKGILKKKFGAQSTQIADEGGFVPPVKNIHERLALIEQAISEAGYSGKLVFAVDAAASEFFKDEKYHVGEKAYSSEEMVDFWADLANQYPIKSIEDGMAEDDWQGWSKLTAKIGDKTQVVGDDLLVTNVERIQKGIEEKAMNSVLLKCNQIGSVTETIDAFNLANKHGMTCVVSHRSGSTEESFIADLVVGLDAGQSKFGAPARTDRVCKYNQLLRIEEELNADAKYLGNELFK